MRISYSAFLLNHTEINWSFKTNYQKSYSIILLFITFIALFGLLIINWIYIFI
jgi:hypothetical protein